MSEKRFRFEKECTENFFTEKGVFYNNERPMGANEIIALLNSLSDENEQLKEEIRAYPINEQYAKEIMQQNQELCIERNDLRRKNEELRNFIDLMNMRQKWKLYNYMINNDSEKNCKVEVGENVKRFELDVRLDMSKLLIDNATNKRYHLLLINDIEEIVALLNEQQATIKKLQDLCGESDSENAKLRIENEKLRKELSDCEKFRYQVFKRMGELSDE